jgi:hypothetical protein
MRKADERARRKSKSKRTGSDEKKAAISFRVYSLSHMFLLLLLISFLLRPFLLLGVPPYLSSLLIGGLAFSPRFWGHRQDMYLLLLLSIVSSRFPHLGKPSLWNSLLPFSFFSSLLCGFSSIFFVFLSLLLEI